MAGTRHSISIEITAQNEQLVKTVANSINQLGRLNSGAGVAAGGMGNLASASTSTMTKLSQLSMITLGASQAFYLLKSGLEATLVPFIKFNADMEQAQIGFETMLGSQKAAALFMQQLQKFAADTPFEFPQLQEASKKFLAFGFSAKEVIPALTAVGNAVAGLGGGEEKIRRVTIALGQMKAKGRVQGEELLQLAEAGIPAYAILSQKLGLTGAQVANIGNEAINADTAIKALIEGMNEKFPNMMEKQSNTFIGMLATIKDNIMLIGSALTESIFKGLKDSIAGVRDFTNQLMAAFREGNFDKVMKDTLSEPWRKSLIEAYTSVKSFIANVKAAFGQIGPVVGPTIKAIGKLFLDMIPYVVDIGNALLKIGRSIAPVVQSALSVINKLIQLIGDNIKKAVLLLGGFLMVNRIVAIVTKLQAAWVAVRTTMMLLTSQTVRMCFAAMITGAVSAIKSIRSLRDAVRLLGVAFQNLSKKNVILFALSVGTMVAGDKIMDWMDKFTSSDKQDTPEEPPKDNADLEQWLKEATEALNAHTGTPSPDMGNTSQSYNKAKDGAELAISQLKGDSERIKAEIQSKIDELEAKGSQQGGSTLDELRQIAQLRLQLKQAELDQLQKEQQIKATLVDQADPNSVSEAQKAISELQNSMIPVTAEIDKLRKEIESMGITTVEARRSLADGSKAYELWAADNPDIDNMRENTKAKMEAFAVWFYEQTGKMLTVTSGYRNWGGHVNGTKFDASNDEFLDAEFRSKAIEAAKQFGLAVLDEYANPSSRATGKHLDFEDDGQALQAKSIKQVYQGLKERKEYTKDFNEYIKAANELLNKVQEVESALATVQGNAKMAEKVDIEKRWEPYLDVFKANGMEDSVNKTLKLIDAQKAKVELDTALSDWEVAKQKFETDLEEVNRKFLADGDEQARDAGYTKARNDYVASSEELRAKAENASKATTNPEDARKVENAVRDMKTSIRDAVLRLLEEEQDRLETELTNLDNDANLTDETRKDLQDRARQKSSDKQRPLIKEGIDLSAGLGDSKTVESLKKVESGLTKIPTLMDRIRQSANNALEGGLKQFFNDILSGTASAGEAFKNLALTVLQAIQDMLVQMMVASIMKSILGLNSGGSVNGKAGGGIIKRSVGGPVWGAGTATSDSIPAMLSNGEYVIKASSVSKYGIAFLDALNSGRLKIPQVPRFAVGGVVGGSKALAQALSVSATTGEQSFNIINLVDQSMMKNYIKSSDGTKTLINVLQSNKNAVKKVIL